MKDKLAILMPDGVGIRNYIYTDVFDDLNQNLTLLHNFKQNTLENLGLSNAQFSIEKLTHYKETPREKFLRELIHLSRLKYNSKQENNLSILSNYMPKKNSLKLKLFYGTVELFSKFYNEQHQIKKLEIKYDKAIRQSKVYKFYLNYFRTKGFSLIFCTHQRAVIAAPIFAAAKDAGLKTSTAIYSWDNLPKARLALRADEYFVWSPHMKNELQTFYPELKDEQIKIVGTPQFEFHYDKSYLWSKEKFADYYDLDVNKKWLCFSGDDKTTSPFDQDYLKDTAEVIKNSELSNQWQILLRPVPVEGFEKYQNVINQYPQIIKKTGAVWKLTSHWSDVYPEQKDLNILTSLCEHADAVVNVGSTMAIDFGMHNKPAIYINYDANPNSKWSIRRVYQFQHFRTMKGLGPIIWLSSPSELIDILKNLNEYHNKTKTDMEKWCEIIIPKHLRTKSSQLIQKELLK